MLYDKTLEFEQHKDEPVRYNRDLYVETISAMNKLDEIKQERQRKFWKARMDAAKETNQKAVINELKKHSKLIKNPEVKEKITKKIKKDEKHRVRRNMKKSQLQELIDEEKEEESDPELMEDAMEVE